MIIISRLIQTLFWPLHFIWLCNALFQYETIVVVVPLYKHSTDHFDHHTTTTTPPLPHQMWLNFKPLPGNLGSWVLVCSLILTQLEEIWKTTSGARFFFYPKSYLIAVRLDQNEKATYSSMGWQTANFHFRLDKACQPAVYHFLFFCPPPLWSTGWLERSISLIHTSASLVCIGRVKLLSKLVLQHV